MFTRRFFIGGASAFCAATGCRIFAGTGGSSGKPRMKIGVLSDIHIGGRGQEMHFKKALEYFKSAGVDGVLVAGDMADNGKISQLKVVADAWFSVFPDGKDDSGRKVEQLFIYGNHDFHGPGKNASPEAKADCINLAPEKVWEECFHEEFSPVWLKRVNGVPVIGMHWPRTGTYGGHFPIDKWLERHGGELDPKMPFIYTQHAHPKDTCIGPWAWGHDDGASTKALSKFPGAVALSGHSHYTLTDERSVWQGAFTSINTSSLKYSSVDYSLRENINGNGSGYRGEKRKHLMDQIKTGNGRQGMVVSVFDTHLEIERREFVTDKSLGDDWIVPLPAAENGPWESARRAAKRAAPQFAEGAAVSVAVKKGPKDRDVVEVSFPAAKTVDKCRVFEYEVTATLAEDGVDLVQAQRRALAADFFLPETPEGAPGRMVFALDELPMKGDYRFSVRPIECFGKKGEAIWSGTVKIGDKA